MVSEENKQFLLRLARKALDDTLEEKESNLENIPEELRNKGASFITLNVNGKTKGSIGTLFEHQELFMDVIENVKVAAFEDPRFPPLMPEDLKNTEIEISVITKLKKLSYESEIDLLNQINKGIQGVIVAQGIRIGTLLPQEWKKVSDKVQFLQLICQKAKLDKDAWQHPSTEIYVYETETFNEKNFLDTIQNKF